MEFFLAIFEVITNRTTSKVPFRTIFLHNEPDNDTDFFYIFNCTRWHRFRVGVSHVYFSWFPTDNSWRSQFSSKTKYVTVGAFDQCCIFSLANFAGLDSRHQAECCLVMKFWCILKWRYCLIWRFFKFDETQTVLLRHIFLIYQFCQSWSRLQAKYCPKPEIALKFCCMF